MKKIALPIVTFALLFMGTNAFAQGKWGADSAECIKYMSYYKEYYKQKAYDQAIPNWRQAYKFCPATANQHLLIDGTTLVRQLIAKNAANAEYSKALVDTLMTLHDKRAVSYPNYAISARNNKGFDMANYIKNDNEKLFKGYEEIITANNTGTKPQIYIFDLQAAINLYQAGGTEAQTVIKTYQRNQELLENTQADSDTEKEQNASIKTDMGNLFAASKVASCETLISIYTPIYEASPNDLQVAKSIVATMSLTEDCSSNDLYLKAVTTMNTLEPSAKSSYYLYKLHSQLGNSEEAIKYLTAAIDREDSDAATDIEWTYELAAFSFKNGHSAKAYEYASKVAEAGGALAGKAYFLMGTIWGSTHCGGDEIASRAQFWVACDYMNRAKAADASLTEEANRYIGQYSSYFPQAADAFMYSITNGQAYTVVCGGMRATTTVRTVK